MVDGSAYAGVMYEVLESPAGKFDSGANSMTSGLLDASGYASFELKMKNNKSYVLVIQEPNGICVTQAIVQESLKREGNNNIDFNYEECGNLQFVLNNVNCNDPLTDNLKYKRIEAGSNIGIENGQYISVDGCISFESGYIDLPIGEYEYIWEVTKNMITTYHSETFTLSANEYKTFQLDY